MAARKKTLRVEADLHRRLKVIATTKDRSLEAEANDVIRRHVEAQEKRGSKAAG
jgi:plasmid stability protein